MIILFVSNSSWSMWNFRRDLIENLSKNSSHQVHVAAPKDCYTNKLIEKGVVFHEIPLNPKGFNPLHDLILLIRLAFLYLKLRPAIAIHYTIKPNIYGPIAARLLGIPSIAVITGLGYTFINKNLISRIGRNLYRFGLSAATEAWFLNSDDMELFANSKIVHKNKCILLPGEGIDIKYYSPRETPLKKSFSFLLIGRILKDKGIIEYAMAAEKLKTEGLQFQAKIIGKLNAENPTGIPLKTLQKWTSNSTIEVLSETDDIRPFIAESDCIVLPSYREGISRALLEGAAMAKPLIASDVPGCKEVIKNKINGLLVPAKNWIALSEAMSKILQMPESEREKMGKEGRDLVKSSFSLQTVLNLYLYRIDILTNSSKKIQNKESYARNPPEY